jgi:hypothetical protein
MLLMSSGMKKRMLAFLIGWGTRSSEHAWAQEPIS